jgi:LEA14-like dessication related protein
MVVILGLWVLSLLSGCAGMTNSQFEQPVVSLSSFRMLPQEMVSPKFEIGLHIINPNRESLSFEGIYYTVNIEGYDVLAGVSNNLPTVDPYGEADVLLEANVDLLKSIRLISSLMQQPRDRFKYSFNAKLDPGGLNPKITIQEDGEFNLQN